MDLDLATNRPAGLSLLDAYLSSTEPANIVAAIEKFHAALLHDQPPVVRELLNNGLDPNYINRKRCLFDHDDHCCGYTLLHIACVHGRMAIVKILLQAGADPDETNLDVRQEITPFRYALRYGKLELARVLLRDSVTPVRGQLDRDGRRPLHFTMFRQFHDDEDALKCIMAAASLNPRKFLKPDIVQAKNPFFKSIIYIAAKRRCAKLFKFVMTKCGVENVVAAVLNQTLNYGTTETMSYLIEQHGAKNFTENDSIVHMMMESKPRGMLELLLQHFQQVHGDNREWWMDRMMRPWDVNNAPSLCFLHGCIEKSQFDVLLRFGVYSVLRDLPLHQSVLNALAKAGKTDSAHALIGLYPRCLREGWLRVWRRSQRLPLYPPHQPQPVHPSFLNAQNAHRAEQKVEAFIATLVKKRGDIPTLKILCRSAIFHKLGINPIPKAERLPLPSTLKDFVLCKDLFEERSSDNSQGFFLTKEIKPLAFKPFLSLWAAPVTCRDYENAHYTRWPLLSNPFYATEERGYP